MCESFIMWDENDKGKIKKKVKSEIITNKISINKVQFSNKLVLKLMDFLFEDEKKSFYICNIIITYFQCPTVYFLINA